MGDNSLRRPTSKATYIHEGIFEVLAEEVLSIVSMHLGLEINFSQKSLESRGIISGVQFFRDWSSS